MLTHKPQGAIKVKHKVLSLQKERIIISRNLLFKFPFWNMQKITFLISDSQKLYQHWLLSCIEPYRTVYWNPPWIVVFLSLASWTGHKDPFVSVWLAYIHYTYTYIYTYVTCMSGAHGDQRRMSHPLKMVLLMVVSCNVSDGNQTLVLWKSSHRSYLLAIPPDQMLQWTLFLWIERVSLV